LCCFFVENVLVFFVSVEFCLQFYMEFMDRISCQDVEVTKFHFFTKTADRKSCPLF